MFAKQNVECSNDDGIWTRDDYLMKYESIKTDRNGNELIDFHGRCVPTKDKGNRCLIYKSHTDNEQFYDQAKESMYENKGTLRRLNFTDNNEAKRRIENSRIFMTKLGEPCDNTEVMRYCLAGKIDRQECSNVWTKVKKTHYEVRIIYPGFAMTVKTSRERQEELVYVLNGPCKIKNGRIQYVMVTNGEISQQDDKLFEYVKGRYAISYGDRVFIMEEDNIEAARIRAQEQINKVNNILRSTILSETLNQETTY